MATLEKVFGIPASHFLKQTKFYSHAGGQEEGWHHEEYDAEGQLVARYETWANTTIYGVPTTEGWKKFDLAGKLIASGNDLSA